MIENGYLKFKQQKTNEYERLKLNNNALEILSSQRKSDGKYRLLVFNLPGNVTINRQLRKWISKTKINKHISFHCSRHTFATLCLTYDVDIYTVSKLLGHRNIQTTQIYAKLIDKKKDEAIDKLPTLS
jgi:integrase